MDGEAPFPRGEVYHPSVFLCSFHKLGDASMDRLLEILKSYSSTFMI
jgi:hypothetical protein